MGYDPEDLGEENIYEFFKVLVAALLLSEMKDKYVQILQENEQVLSLISDAVQEGKDMVESWREREEESPEKGEDNERYQGIISDLQSKTEDLEREVRKGKIHTQKLTQEN